MEGRIVEYVDHLHEHFVDPVRVRDGRYLVPEAPGYSITMKPASLARFEFPDGPAWIGQSGAPGDPGLTDAAGVGGVA
jgi:L-fuconate dehydratase